MSILRASLASAAGCLFFAVALFNAASAKAETITYDFVDYPTAEIDTGTSDQDKISGTITATSSGTLGTYTPSPTTDTLSYDVTLSSSNGFSYNWTGSGPINEFIGSGSATFTSSAILLNGYLNFTYSNMAGSGDLYYRSDIDTYMGTVGQSGEGTVLHFDQSPATSLDPAPWTVAVAAPEPASMALGVSALVTLGVAALARARRKR
jgi:hypothetical protein